jgi:hypothetical protein
MPDGKPHRDRSATPGDTERVSRTIRGNFNIKINYGERLSSSCLPV